MPRNFIYTQDFSLVELQSPLVLIARFKREEHQGACRACWKAAKSCWAVATCSASPSKNRAQR